MSYNNLSPGRIEEINTRITQLETSLSLAYTAFDEALTTGGVESFKFDSGEGSQWAKYHSYNSLYSIIERIESQIEFLNRKLNNRSNVILALRRKYGTSYGTI